MYLRPNTCCHDNCVYTDKLLGKQVFTDCKEKVIAHLSIIMEVQINRVETNEVLLAHSESLAALIKFYN